jgi:predicted nucleotidyltransferase
MRINAEQIQAIKTHAHHYFGEDASLWLFGSRTNDAERGGDVDLYVEPTHNYSLLSVLQCKIAIEESLDLQVDLIVKEAGKDRPIYRIAKLTGIVL